MHCVQFITKVGGFFQIQIFSQMTAHQTSANNLTGYRYSKSAIIRGQKLGQIVVRYLTSIHQFYDSTTFQLRHQSFDNRLNDKPQVGTPIRRSLLHTNQYQVFDPYSHWLLPSFILLTFELTSITEI